MVIISDKSNTYALARWRKGNIKIMARRQHCCLCRRKNPKTTMVTGVATFAGWRKLSNSDESLGTAVGKTLRSGTDKGGNFAHDVVNGYTGDNTVEQVKDTTKMSLRKSKKLQRKLKGC